MSNMSYCRFENTLGDMRDCAAFLEEELEEGEALKLSLSERRAFNEMYNMMQDMLTNMEAIVERDPVK